MRFKATIFLISLIGLPVRHGLAAEFCIGASASQLETALIVAASNGQDDIIHFEGGQYSVPSDLDMHVVEPYSLTFEGGYSHSVLGNACDIPPQSPNATATVLSGNGSARLSLFQAAGALSFHNMTIDNMYSSQVMNAGVVIVATDIMISNVIFSNNSALLHANGVVFSAGDGIRIQNSLFFLNGSFGAGPAIELVNGNTTGSICNLIVNSTFADNLTSAYALAVTNIDCATVVANDLFWNRNAGNGDAIFVSGSTHLINDAISIADGQIVSEDGLVSIDPLFVNPLAGNYALKDDSPLRELGSNGAPLIWGPGQWDVAGNSRVDGKYPDIGAFEIQDVIFASGADWTW